MSTGWLTFYQSSKCLTACSSWIFKSYNARQSVRTPRPFNLNYVVDGGNVVIVVVVAVVDVVYSATSRRCPCTRAQYFAGLTTALSHATLSDENECVLIAARASLCHVYGGFMCCAGKGFERRTRNHILTENCLAAPNTMNNAELEIQKKYKNQVNLRFIWIEMKYNSF